MLQLRVLLDNSAAAAVGSSFAADFSPLQVTCRALLKWRVLDLKQHLQQLVEFSNFPIANLFWKGQLLCDTDELLLFDFNPQNSILTVTKQGEAFRVCEANTLECFVNRAEGYRLAPVLKALRDVNAHFAQHPNLKSKPATQEAAGSGGLYFIKNYRSQVLACFKPRAEELGAALNPTSHSLRVGVLPGHGAEREAAAFALDHSGFAGVPPTVLVQATASSFAGSVNEDKIGSFQYFHPNAEENVGDYSAHLFPVQDVHKVALLDIRCLNMDRNDSNLLVVVKQNGARQMNLVPIDHGLCFPDRIEIAWCDWVWWDWPQTLEPFSLETKQWVAALDVHKDIEILRNTFGLSKQCTRIFYCMTTLLQCSISKYNLNLREIAGVVVRSRDLDQPSAMEKTMQRAEELTELMSTNRRKSLKKDIADEDSLYRSSSFDGLLSSNAAAAAAAAVSKKASESDKLFFSYVDRLIDDICQEVLLTRQQQSNSTSPALQSCSSSCEESTWFDVSQRISPSELSKMPSPRLQPIKPKKVASAATNGLPIDGFADFSLQ